MLEAGSDVLCWLGVGNLLCALVWEKMRRKPHLLRDGGCHRKLHLQGPKMLRKTFFPPLFLSFARNTLARFKSASPCELRCRSIIASFPDVSPCSSRWVSCRAGPVGNFEPQPLHLLQPREAASIPRGHTPRSRGDAEGCSREMRILVTASFPLQGWSRSSERSVRAGHSRANVFSLCRATGRGKGRKLNHFYIFIFFLAEIPSFLPVPRIPVCETVCRAVARDSSRQQGLAQEMSGNPGDTGSADCSAVVSGCGGSSDSIARGIPPRH